MTAVTEGVVMALPLRHGVELVRGLTTGALRPLMLVHLGYCLAMIVGGVVLTTRRLRAVARSSLSAVRATR